MKKLLFGIVLVLFGISCLFSGQYWNTDVLSFIGTVVPFFGVLIAILGLTEKNPKE